MSDPVIQSFPDGRKAADDIRSLWRRSGISMTVETVRASELNQYSYIYVEDLKAFFDRDLISTAEDDGATVLHDQNGVRFVASVSGNGSGSVARSFQTIFDASSGSFPAQDVDGNTVRAGQQWLVTTAGTIDGEVFAVNDRLIAIIDNPATDTFLNNWRRLSVSSDDVEETGNIAVASIAQMTMLAASVQSQYDAIQAANQVWSWNDFQAVFRDATPQQTIYTLADIGKVSFDAGSGQWRKSSDGAVLQFAEGLVPSWFTIEANGFLLAEYQDLVVVKSATLAENKIMTLAEAVAEYAGVHQGGTTYRFPVTAVPGWTGSEFSFFSEHEETARVNSNEYLVTASDGSNNERSHLQNSGTGADQDVWGNAQTSGGAFEASLFTQNNAANGLSKSGFSAAANSFALSVNGSAPLTDSAGAMPVGLDRIYFNGNAVGALVPWTGNHTTAAFPRGIPAADLQARSA